MNRVEIAGTLVRDPDIKAFAYSSLLTFQVAVNGSAWNRETRQQEVTTTYVSVEKWFDDAIEEDDVPYKGAEVHLVGELTQYKREGEKQSHTRVRALTMTILRRGRQAKQEAQQGWTSQQGDEPPF